MNIGQLRRDTQEFSSSTLPVYVLVGGILYPVGEIQLSRDSATIVAVEPEGEEVVGQIEITPNDDLGPNEARVYDDEPLPTVHVTPIAEADEG